MAQDASRMVVVGALSADPYQTVICIEAAREL
jgi:hypothetical protein